MSGVAGSLGEWQVQGEGEKDRVALFPVRWGRAVRPEPLPFPRDHICAGLTGNNPATTPTRRGCASAGTEHRLVKLWPIQHTGQGARVGSALTQWAAHQLGGFRAPGHRSSPPPHCVLEEGPWSVGARFHPWCEPLLSSPLPFPGLCSEWVSSRELDLGVKTQRQGSLQADCSWPCAGLGCSAPWGLFCLPEWIYDVAVPTAPRRAAVPAPGSHAALAHLTSAVSSSSHCLPFIHQARCFPSALYISCDSLFPD